MVVRKSFKKVLSRWWIVYLMILPGFLLTGLLSYGPMVGLYMAFVDYRVGRPLFSAEFVGLEFFRLVLRDSVEVGAVLRNTLGMNIISLVVGMFVALMFAIMLNEVANKKIKKSIQTVSFIPFFVSWVIVYNMLQVFFQGGTGIIPNFMRSLGFEQQGLGVLADPRWSWTLVVLSNLWKSLGYNAVIFLASITSIDTGMYEAAAIDGATRLQSIRYITLPQLMPTLQILLILNVGWIFNSNFDQFFLFTNPLNRPTMEAFDMYIFRFGLRQLDYSYATAVGILRSVAGFVVLIIVNGISRKLDGGSVA